MKWVEWWGQTWGRKISRIVWLCEFRDDINGWDLKILYMDLESWKKRLKKNRMEWFVRLESWMVWNSMEWNGMSGMVCPNMGYID